MTSSSTTSFHTLSLTTSFHTHNQPINQSINESSLSFSGNRRFCPGGQPRHLCPGSERLWRWMSPKGRLFLLWLRWWRCETWAVSMHGYVYKIWDVLWYIPRNILNIHALLRCFMARYPPVLPTTFRVNSLSQRDGYMRRETRLSLVQIMAWRLFGTKPLSEPMMC